MSKTAAISEQHNSNLKRIDKALRGGDPVAIVVFGKKLRKDGTLDYRGQTTVEKVATLQREIVAGFGGEYEWVAQMSTIILTGGKSSSYRLRGVEVPTEAGVMYNALKADVGTYAQFKLEENSFDTIGNIIFSYPHVEAVGARMIVLVAERPMMDRTLKETRRVFGGSYDILVEPAEVRLSALYRAYNRVKEWASHKFLFERNFKDIADGDVAAFREKNAHRTVYKKSTA